MFIAWQWRFITRLNLIDSSSLRRKEVFWRWNVQLRGDSGLRFFRREMSGYISQPDSDQAASDGGNRGTGGSRTAARSNLSVWSTRTPHIISSSTQQPREVFHILNRNRTWVLWMFKPMSMIFYTQITPLEQYHHNSKIWGFDYRKLYAFPI